MVTELAQSTIEEVAAAVNRAIAAQRSWASLPAPRRRVILRQLARLVEDNKDRLAAELVRENFCTVPRALGEVAACVEELYNASDLAVHSLGEIVPSAMPGRTNIVERVPLGVIAVIASWNSPMSLAFRALAPALALGNAVLVKPSPETPSSGGEAWIDLVSEAGVEPGLVTLVPNRGAGRAFVQHPDIEFVHFTGSYATGMSIATEAAKSMKKVAMELGGNNAALILHDADIDLAARESVGSSFDFQGQVCIATGRHIVVRPVAVAYEAALIREVQAYGSLGPMITEKQAHSANELVKKSIDMGAQLLI